MTKKNNSPGRSSVIPRKAQSAFPVLAGGVLTGIGTLLASTSFAALIFSGGLEPYLARGIGIALFTAVVAGVLVSLLSSCVRSIAIPQDRIAPVLAIMAGYIAASLPPDTPPGEVFVTVVAAIALTSLVTGLFLTLMGLFRIGELIRFLPYSVLGGFLAGTGWLLLLGGLRVMSNSHLGSPAEIAGLLEPGQLEKWLPGIGIAILLMALSSRVKHAVALPSVLVLASFGFFALADAAGYSPQTLAAAGWLLGPIQGGESGLWHPLAIADLRGVNWTAILDNVGSIGTVMLLSAVSILLTVSALEMLTRRDLDVNRELRVAGLTNLTSALGGGMVAFHSLSFSALAITLGTKSRLVGVISALICAAALWAGPQLFDNIPRLVLGGLLAFLGMSFLYEWLIKSWTRLPRSEYAIVLLILFTMAGFGFMTGMAAGLLAAIVLFVVNYSRIDVVRRAMSGNQRRSRVERHSSEEQFLGDHGDRIYVLKLQGYLFFGTTRALQRAIEQRAQNKDFEPLRFVVLDFKQVTGIDPSAIHIFAKIADIAVRERLFLVLTELDARFHRQLDSGAVDPRSLSALKRFPDLDHGLEWCEDQILQGLDKRSLEGEISILKQICSRLDSPAQRTAFEGCLERLSLPAGAHLAHQGNPSDCLYFVESGTVSVYLHTEKGGHPIRLSRTGPGTVIGELGLYLRAPRSASVIADTETRLFRLSAGDLTRMERETPDIAVVFHRFMAELSSERLIRSTRMLEALSE